MARNTTANVAQILAINLQFVTVTILSKTFGTLTAVNKTNLDVNPFGQSILTDAWKRMAQTSQYVRKSEKRWLVGAVICTPIAQRPVCEAIGKLNHYLQQACGCGYVTCMLYPDGESHSKMNMATAATWIATTPTRSQDAVSNGSCVTCQFIRYYHLLQNRVIILKWEST